MFDDTTIFTIWVSQNIAIALLAIFMWYISKLSRDENRQEVEFAKVEADQKL